MGFFYQKYAFYASKEQSEYVYDICGQLIRENNSALDKTFIYCYNNIGNIIGVKTYAYTTAANPTGTYTAKTYTYDTACPDKLTKVGSKSIGYNSLGCPTSYDGKTFTWSKGKLTRISRSSTLSGTERYTYTYNAKGQRVKKLYTFFPGQQALADYVTSATTTYTYDNSGRLIREYYVEIYKGHSSSDREFIYLYDESGMVGFNFWRDGVDQGVFYYHRNLQGDVIAIYDASGAKVAGYSYDAWGNCTATSYGTSGISRINPIRYRGYYYDTETGWYFLNARYYSPEWRRFISPDDTAYLDPENPNGLNLYCYCNNDPVNYADPSGHSVIAALLIGLGIGVAAGLGYAAYTDYQDDYDINGSIGLNYLWWGIIGGAIGAGIGLPIGYFGPALAATVGSAISSLFTFGAGNVLALAGGGVSSAASVKVLLVAAGVLMWFASNNRPGNNQAQNKQFEDAARRAGYNPKDPYIKDQLQKVHRYIRQNDLDPGWKELIELIKEWLG